MATNYTRGRAFEYVRKAFYEEMGYAVLRTAGSHGLFDLVAIRGTQVMLIQCKRVRSQSAADLLIKRWKESPPLTNGPTQVLDVYVQATRKVERTWI